jgi:hypothetical protein
MEEAATAEGYGDPAIYEALEYTKKDVKHLVDQNNYIYIIGAAYQYDKHRAISFLKQFFPLIKNNPIGLSLLIPESCMKIKKNFIKVPNKRVSMNFSSNPKYLIGKKDRSH